MEQEQIRCPVCNETYSRLLSRWKFCPFCGNQARNGGVPTPSVLEKPALTVAEVAALMGLSRSAVTELFEKERGVIILNRPETMHKRRYRSLRIPRAVFERVKAKLTVKN